MINYLLKFLWRYKYILICLLLILFILGLIKKLNYYKAENERKQHNIENMKFEYETIKGKNDEYHIAVNSLTLQKDELEHFNENLKQTIDSMKIKTKNLESATKVKYSYKNKAKNKIYSKSNKSELVALQKEKDSLLKKNDEVSKARLKEIDSLQKLLKKSYKIDYSEKGYRIATDVILDDNQVYLDNFNYFYTDSIIIVGETMYKKRWIFWRRPIGVKLHLKSNNPAFHFDKVETYKFR